MSGEVLLIDWLGRGGIAQTSWAWIAESPRPVVVVTRAGRDLARCPAAADVRVSEAMTDGDGRAAGPGPVAAVAAHRRVVASAVRSIDELRPEIVVVQNHVLPLLERPVAAACRRTGAKLVVVVHNHRAHTIAAGIDLGLRRSLQSADVVVAHSRFVASAVETSTGRRDVVLVPLPMPIGMPGISDPVSPSTGCDHLVAIHFGVVQRKYKGSDVVRSLAASGQPGWDFTVVGTGAESGPGLVAMDRYVDDAELVSLVSRSSVTLLPYRAATQSGAITVAHARGSVPVATAVGGICEQIADGVDGRLLAPSASMEVWASVLHDLRDPEVRLPMARAGADRVRTQHQSFVEAIAGILA